jgi:Cys-tRNA(Pro) deacylase
MHSTLKALLLEDSKNNLYLALFGGDEKLDFTKIAKMVGNGKIHIAAKHRIESATGFHIGAISTFGFRQPLPILLDSGVLESETVVFNAGDHSVSIHMKAKDLLKINPDAILAEITTEEIIFSFFVEKGVAKQG